MIITDGTTSLTFTGTQLNDFVNIEKATSRSAGGLLKSQDQVKDFVIERVRLTGAQWQSLFDLLTNGNELFYTPTSTPDYMAATDFPMNVDIQAPRKIRHAGGDTKVYYVELRITGVDLL